MEKWYWILAGLMALDGLITLLARPVAYAPYGDTDRWLASSWRNFGGILAGGFLIALIVLWNIEANLPKK